MKIGDWVVATQNLEHTSIEAGECGEIIGLLPYDLVVIDWDLHGEYVCELLEFKEMENFDD